MTASNPQDSGKKCGFVALIGAPNAGKSTLMNRLVGQKVSIVTHKAQTTRSRITGIVPHKNAQIIFHDLPGIFDAAKKFDKAMVRAAWSALADADIGLVLIDASKPVTGKAVSRLLTLLENRPNSEGDQSGAPPLALALNKIDQADKDTLLPLTQELNERIAFDKTFMISAQSGAGCPDILDWLVERLPEGPWLYDEEDVTDLPAKLLAAEFTREQVFENLHQEIPYGATVQTERIETNKDGSLSIDQIIFVQKDSHKGMVIGKSGQTLKRLGTRARKSLETVFDGRVHLNLLVKVREDWSADPEVYKMWGLD